MRSTRSFGTRGRGGSVLVVLLLASTLGVMGGATIAPLIEVIRKDLEVGGTAAGIFLTCHSLAIALASPLAGHLTDRLGPRLPLAVGLLLYGTGGGAGLVLDSYPALLASRLVLGAGAAAVFTCSTVALLALYKGPERDRVMGWRTTATSAGGFVYPLLAGVLGRFSWRIPFALYLVGIPLGIAVLLTLPRSSTPETGPASTRETAEGGALRLLREHPVLLALCGLWVATMGLLMVFAVFLPQRLDQVGVQDTFLVALYGVVIASAVASLVGLGYARLRRRLGYRTLMQIAAASWASALLVFAVAGDPVMLQLVPALTGLGTGIAMPTLTVLVDRSVPADRRGTATSLQATALFGGQFGSPLLFGPLIDSTSITVGALVSAAGASAIVFALFC
ncbi:MFS transporter [Actinomadura welshii]|uniref:MFS transporter n=1 Tax=Actinomadura welshii TaxID=3103817 RepID=UPI0003AD5B13|nr:MFS transporter [Actinomadura madurae]